MPYNLTSLHLRPICDHWAARASVGGVIVPSGAETAPLALTVGGITALWINVTAQDNATYLAYTVAVYRPFSHVCDLIGLTHDAVGAPAAALQPAFDHATLTYHVSVAGGVSTMRFFPTPLETTTSILVNGLPTPGGGPSSAVAIVMGGTTTVVVRATAQDGVTSRNYVVLVYRPSQIADLADIQVRSCSTLEALQPSTLTPPTKAREA